MARNTANPKKITALAAGVAVALGVAGWRISDAVGGGGGSASPAPAPAAPAPSASAQPTAAPTGAEVTQPAAPGAPAGEPGAGRMAAGGAIEEALAFTVDPFAQIQVAPQPPAVKAPPVVSKGGGTLYPGLGPLPPGNGTGTVAPPVQVVPQAPPQLVGTMLGDTPSAVFKTDAGLRVVRRGGQIDTWRVVAVQHGAATVRSGKISHYLTVNARMGTVEVTPAKAVAETPSTVETMMGMAMPVAFPEPAPAAPSPGPAELPVRPAPVPVSAPAPAPVPEKAPEPVPPVAAPPAPPAAPVPPAEGLPPAGAPPAPETR